MTGEARLVQFGCIDTVLPGRERLMSASCWAVLKELEEMRTEVS